METVTLEIIHKDLEFVKRELMEIKEHMVDIDSIMTEDDYKALHEYKIEKLRKAPIIHDTKIVESSKGLFISDASAFSVCSAVKYKRKCLNPR